MTKELYVVCLYLVLLVNVHYRYALWWKHEATAIVKAEFPLNGVTERLAVQLTVEANMAQSYEAKLGELSALQHQLTHIILQVIDDKHLN